MLEGLNLGKEALDAKIREYEPESSRENPKFSLADGINLYFTEGLRERPVNIVIRKAKLDAISDFHRNI